MPTPFKQKEFIFHQPDGSPLKVRGTGDQFYAEFETPDGYTVMRDAATGYYTYATKKYGLLQPGTLIPGEMDPAAAGIDQHLKNPLAAIDALVQRAPGLTPGRPRWQQRREEVKSGMVNAMLYPGLAQAPPSRQTVGNYIGLCLLIQFPDVPGTITPDQVRDFCNKPGYTDFGNNGSVYDYYNDVSDGRLKYTNIITPYYTAKNPKAYYTDARIPQGQRAKELILEALDHFKNSGFDLSALSTDSGNYVYAVNAFYAGGVDNNWAEGLWPHSSHLDIGFDLGNGRLAYDYQISDLGYELSLGTFCHENGHMICSFPDLYSYGSMPKGDGIYCLMCLGCTVDKKNPTKICAYLKREAGWIDKITTLAAPMQGTIESEKNEYLLFSRNDLEYFIIENREQTGRDASLTDSGLAIWHINEQGDNTGRSGPNVSYECALIQADGRNDLENGVNTGDNTDLFKNGGNNEFGKTTLPASNWLDGTASGLDVKDIGAAGETMSFTIA
jgi:M6 family metalloprotease-like protein